MADRPRVWSGRVNKWVFASKVYFCPKCSERWGGAETGYKTGDEYDRKRAEPVADRICEACRPLTDVAGKVWT